MKQRRENWEAMSMSAEEGTWCPTGERLYPEVGPPTLGTAEKALGTGQAGRGLRISVGCPSLLREELARGERTWPGEWRAGGPGHPVLIPSTEAQKAHVGSGV